MALTQCPECDQKVSGHAKFCSNCGYPIGTAKALSPLESSAVKSVVAKENKFKTPVLVVGYMIALVASIIVGYLAMQNVAMNAERSESSIAAQAPSDPPSKQEESSLVAASNVKAEPLLTSSTTLRSGLEVTIEELYNEYADEENVESLTFEAGSGTATKELKAVITYKEPYTRNDFPNLVKSFVNKIMNVANENGVVVFYLEVGLKQNDKLSIYWQSYNDAQANDELKIGDVADRDNNVRTEDVEYDKIPKEPSPVQSSIPNSQSGPSSAPIESSAVPPSAPQSSSTAQSGTTYRTVLDVYSEKLKAATPGLVAEYNREAANHKGDITALAELSAQIVGKLAGISAEGMGKMAEIMIYTGGSYDTYEEWAGKLSDVYMEEAGKITDAYMKSAM